MWKFKKKIQYRGKNLPMPQVNKESEEKNKRRAGPNKMVIQRKSYWTENNNTLSGWNGNWLVKTKNKKIHMNKKIHILMHPSYGLILILIHFALPSLPTINTYVINSCVVSFFVIFYGTSEIDYRNRVYKKTKKKKNSKKKWEKALPAIRTPANVQTSPLTPHLAAISTLLVQHNNKKKYRKQESL